MKGLNEAHGAVLKTKQNKKKKRIRKKGKVHKKSLGDGKIEKVHILMIRKTG